MKKIFICAAFALVTLGSCKKEATNIASEQVASIAENSTANSANDPTRMHIKVDLSGITFPNGCTNEEMLVISGVLNVNTHEDGTVASTNVHDFVLQSADGTIYRGIWVTTFQVTAPLPDPGAFNNTYKVILTTSGGGNNFVLKGLFHIAENADGEFTVVIDNFTAGCQ